jgi:glycosyltransferase involved in cell wall biosynthesis
MDSREVIHSYGSVPDIPYVLSQASIGVLSSKSEGLPLSLLEYGKAGLPVVVTDVGQCPELVQHKSNGMIVAPQNPKALASAIEYLIQNPSEAQEYAKGLQAKVHESYSEDAVIKRFIAMYKDLFV